MNNPWDHRTRALLAAVKARVDASSATRLWIFFHLAVAAWIEARIELERNNNTQRAGSR